MHFLLTRPSHFCLPSYAARRCDLLTGRWARRAEGRVREVPRAALQPQSPLVFSCVPACVCVPACAEPWWAEHIREGLGWQSLEGPRRPHLPLPPSHRLGHSLLVSLNRWGNWPQTWKRNVLTLTGQSLMA